MNRHLPAALAVLVATGVGLCADTASAAAPVAVAAPPTAPSTAAADPVSEADAEPTPEALFDQVYGPEVARVRATRDPDDDVELARTLLGVAVGYDDRPALAAVVLARAADLAGRVPAGYPTAIRALETLARRAPEREIDALQSLAELYLRQSAQVQGTDRARYRGRQLDTLVRVGDLHVRAADYAEAVRAYRTALSVATALRSPKLDAIRAALAFALGRQRIVAEVESLATRLAADPTDAAARERLVRLHVVELDDPDAAARYVRPDAASADVTAKYVVLATMSVERLPERACLEMGAWYAGLAEEASEAARRNVLGRAAAYYERFLALHRGEDADRLGAEVALDRVRDALAKLGGPAVRPVVAVVPASDFRARYGAAFPPDADLAADGRAAASSSLGRRHRPANALRGRRGRGGWQLDGPEGHLRLEWDPPLLGRYVLLFGTPDAPGTDPWGRAAFRVNDGPAVPILGMSAGHAVIIDLGAAAPLKSFHLTIKGEGNPGLAGAEVHAAMGASSGPDRPKAGRKGPRRHRRRDRDPD
jgi:hypothetical protein